jgi:hypothetical protein
MGWKEADSVRCNAIPDGGSHRKEKSIESEVSARLLTGFLHGSTIRPSWIFPKELMPVNLPALSAQDIIVYGNYLLPLDEGGLG